ncbi:hypothetical protein ES703_84896 [subsurface metagenome]
MGKVLALGQITQETINGWAEKFERRDGGYYCRKCGSRTLRTNCHVSIHLKEFGPLCAGPGKVIKINYPYCPNCDGKIDYAQACFHVGIGEMVPAMIKGGPGP